MRKDGDLLTRAISRIFGLKEMLIFSMIITLCSAMVMKIIHMLILWISASPDAKKAILEDLIVTVKNSLEFLTPT